MFLPFIAALALLPGPTTWYGPQRVVYNVQFPGNPYDHDQNDMKVRFVNEHGTAVERIAYFDGASWRANLVAPQPGKYKPTLFRNGKPSSEEGTPAVLLVNQKLPHGFIHVDPFDPKRLMFDDGTAYFPFGFNLGWQTAGITPMASQIAKMGAIGLTWTRIWADSWDGKNPWWPQNDPYAIPEQLWPPALARWQTLADACATAGVNFQMVLFNHGAFSSKTNPNWPDHPWNAAKGGFLKNAGDFFTDPEAKRRTKMWLRYAVARYGSSPNLMAWELFNEAESTDAAIDGRWSDIAAWHKEMVDYIKSIDPYGHLVTTSSTMDQPGLWAAADYYQPHRYSDRLPAQMKSFKFPGDKPSFIGEFGPDNKQPAPAEEKALVRNAIWASLLRNDAGAAMYWYWDRVDQMDLYPEFKAWAEVISLSNMASHSLAKPVAVTSSAGTAEGIRELKWLIVRVRGARGKKPKLKWAGMSDGIWSLQTVDLETAATGSPIPTMTGGALVMPAMDSDDEIALLKLND